MAFEVKMPQLGLTMEEGTVTKWVKQEGDTVKAGDTLGKVGQTANIETAAEPHLHFAVYRNNVPLDPAEFLKAS